MTRSQQAIRATSWNYLSRLTEFGLLFLISAFIARVIGPSKDSLYTLFWSVVATSVSFTGLGLDWVIYKYLPQFTIQGKQNETAALLRKTFIIRIVVACFGAVIVFCLIQASGGGVLARYAVLLPFGVFAAMFIIGQNIAQFGTATLTAGLRTKEVLAINGTVKLLVLALLAVFAWYALLTPASAIIAVTGAAVVAGSIHFGRLLPQLRGPRVALAFTPIAMFGMMLFGNDILSFLLGRQSDILILSYWYPGSPLVSIYDKAFQTGLVVEFIVTVGLSGVLFSIFAEMAARSNARFGEAYLRTLAMIQLAFIPVAVVVCFYAPTLITTIYGNQFAAAAPLLRVFLLLDVIDIGIFGGGLNITLLNVINRERVVLVNRCLWGGVNLIANLYLIPNYGVFAAILTTRACNLSAVCVEYILVQRAIHAGYNFRWLSIATGAACLGLAGIVFLPGGSLANCMIGGLVFVLLSGAVYYFLKPAPILWAWQAFRTKYAAQSSL